MAKCESITAVKRQLTKEGFQHKPTDQTIRLLYKKFLETGSVEDKVRSGRPNSSVNPDNAKKVVAILEDKENFYSVQLNKILLYMYIILLIVYKVYCAQCILFIVYKFHYYRKYIFDVITI